MSKQRSNVAVPMQGVYAALATPRAAKSLEADAGALLDYIDTIVRAGVNGLVLFGSTGEFVHYDVEERKRVLSLALKRSRVPLVVNVSHSAFGAAVDLAENAIDAGAAGILVMPPYFYHYSEGQIFSFYQQFSKLMDGNIPIYLYNIPCFTNPILPELMQRLLATGCFRGVKDSSGEWRSFEAIQAARQQAIFQNLVGNDRIYARARTAGADGIVSGVAAAIPELIIGLERALVGRNQAQVEVLDGHLQQFLHCLDRFPATIGIKQAAVVRGWKQDHAALPFDEGTLAELSDYRHWLEKWLPGVLADSAAG